MGNWTPKARDIDKDVISIKVRNDKELIDVPKFEGGKTKKTKWEEFIAMGEMKKKKRKQRDKWKRNHSGKKGETRDTAAPQNHRR